MNIKKCAVAVCLSFSMLITVSGCGQNVTKAEYDALLSEKKSIQERLDIAETEKQAAQVSYSDLKKEFDSYKEKMKPYEDMTLAQAEEERLKAEQEAQRIKEENEAKKAAEEAAAAQRAAEEQAAKAAEEARGYETGITYDQLARTPDDYKGKKVKFTGKVVQILEGSGQVDMRFAVDNDYNNMLYGVYKSNIVTSRVLENDTITIYGVSTGLYSYKSTMGGTITIPCVSIERIDQQ